MIAFIFLILEEYATPCAWFPALAQTIVSLTLVLILLILLNAPLNLKDLQYWRSSLFKYILFSYIEDKYSEKIKGVFLIYCLLFK